MSYFRTGAASARTLVVLSASLLAAMVLAACGGTPTAQDSATSAPEAAPNGVATTAAPSAEMSLEDVYAALDGTTGQERRQALLDLATGECEEPLDLYMVSVADASQAVTERFAEDTGIPVELYRASNEDILRRVQAEEGAQVSDVADVIANNDLEQAILAREGVLAPLNTPVTEDISVVTDNWAGYESYVYLAAWRDSLEPAPTTWDEVFNTEGLAYQYGDVSWFATLVNDYYVAEQGMTEDEAVAMIAAAVGEGAQIVDGHTLGGQLLAAGEYRVGSSLYYSTISRLIEEGAPIAWQPAVKPLIERVGGVGIHHRTPCPASALLLTEYILTDFQEMLPEFGTTPTRAGVAGGLPEGVETMPNNTDLLLDDWDKWQALHDEVTGAIGGEVRDS